MWAWRRGGNGHNEQPLPSRWPGVAAAFLISALKSGDGPTAAEAHRAVIDPLHHAADGSWRSVVEAGVRRLIPDEAVLAPDVIRAGLALCSPLVRTFLALSSVFLHAGHVAQPLAVLVFAAAAAPAAAHRNRQQHGPHDHADGNHAALEGNEADTPVDLGEVGALIMAWNESLVRVVAALPRSRAVVTPCSRSQAVSTGRIGLHRARFLR